MCKRQCGDHWSVHLQLSHAKEDIAAAEHQLEEISAQVASGAQQDIDVASALSILQSVTAVDTADDVKNLVAAQLEMQQVLERALSDGQAKLSAIRAEVRPVLYSKLPTDRHIRHFLRRPIECQIEQSSGSVEHWASASVGGQPTFSECELAAELEIACV